MVRAGDEPKKVEGGKEDGREGGKGGTLTGVGGHLGYLGNWTQPQMGLTLTLTSSTCQPAAPGFLQDWEL